jgi:DNA-binding response OmpR family regulator
LGPETETSFFDACNNPESAPKQSAPSVPAVTEPANDYNGAHGGAAAWASALETAPLLAGPLSIDPAEFIASLDGNHLNLTPKEFGLLTLFARNRGRLLRREVIEREVWGGHASGRTIDIHVSRLRRILPAGAIQTVVRVGYRFVL